MEDKPEKGQRSAQAAIGWLVVLVALMVASVFVETPQGSIGLKSFVLYWLREILVLGLILVIFVWAGLSKLKKRNNGKNSEE